jgi:hypothetical protein
MSANVCEVSPDVRALSDAELLERFRQCHVTIVGIMRVAVRHARSAGELLAEMKTRIPRNSWLLWLRDNHISFSTAANYKRVFERWHELERHLQDDANLTLTKALRILARPRRKASERTPEQQELPDGALYTVTVVAECISLLRSMPVEHRQRSREWLIRLREEIDSTLRTCE